MTGLNLLIAEDDIELAATLKDGFEMGGSSVTLAFDGLRAMDAAAAANFDAILLDVMLPEVDGFEVTRRLQATGKAPPIVMLTARDSVSDIVRGLDAGAADYVTKPFSFLELAARVRSQVRRGQGRSRWLVAGDLEMNVEGCEVRRDGAVLSLSPSEFKALALLMRTPGRVVLRRDLVAELWGPGYSVDQNNLDAMMSSLRARVDKGFERKLIQTVRGFGYRLEGI